MPNSNKTIKRMLDDFYPYAKEYLGFDKDASISFSSDKENAQNPLGKTAYYDPSNYSVTVYTDNRHPKDIMRSVSHELVHHTQNCRGDLSMSEDTGEGYAQNDEHLREMEREAYEKGNLCFRDWEDGVKANLNPATIYEQKTRRSTISMQNFKNLTERFQSYLNEEGEYKAGDKVKDLRNDTVGTVVEPMAGGVIMELEDGTIVKTRDKFIEKVEGEPMQEGGSMAEYGKIDAEDGLPPSKIGRGNPEYMEAYNAVLVARGEEPLDVQQPDQAYLDALHSGNLEERDVGMEAWMEKFKLYARLPQNQPMDEFMKDNAMYAYRQGMSPKQAAEELRSSRLEERAWTSDDLTPAQWQTLKDIKNGGAPTDWDAFKQLQRMGLVDARHLGGGQYEYSLYKNAEQALAAVMSDEERRAMYDDEALSDYDDIYQESESREEYNGHLWENKIDKIVATALKEYGDHDTQAQGGMVSSTYSSDPEMDQVADIAATVVEQGGFLMQIATALKDQGFSASLRSGVLMIDDKYFMGKPAKFDIGPDEPVQEVGPYVVGMMDNQMKEAVKTDGRSPSDVELVDKVAELMTSDPEFKILKPYVDKFVRYSQSGGAVESSLEAAVPDFVAGRHLFAVMKKAKAQSGQMEEVNTAVIDFIQKNNISMTEGAGDKEARIRDVVKMGSWDNIDGVPLSLPQAELLVAAMENLSPANKEKLMAMPIDKMLDIVNKMVDRGVITVNYGRAGMNEGESRHNTPDFFDSDEEKEMMKKMSNKEFYNYVTRDRHVVPNLKGDMGPMDGMEGPFQFKSGAVLYYDPKAGKYYDRGKDMYLDNEEASRLTMENDTMESDNNNSLREKVKTAVMSRLSEMFDDDDMYGDEDPYMAGLEAEFPWLKDKKPKRMSKGAMGDEDAAMAAAAADAAAAGEFQPDGEEEMEEPTVMNDGIGEGDEDVYETALRDRVAARLQALAEAEGLDASSKSSSSDFKRAAYDASKRGSEGGVSSQERSLIQQVIQILQDAAGETNLATGSTLKWLNVAMEKVQDAAKTGDDDKDKEGGEEAADVNEASTEKHDDDPALKGDQDELPDNLQKAIIDKSDDKSDEDKKEESLAEEKEECPNGCNCNEKESVEETIAANPEDFYRQLRNESRVVNRDDWSEEAQTKRSSVLNERLMKVWFNK